eukprot:3177818-Prymnesium_polylepis.1
MPRRLPGGTRSLGCTGPRAPPARQPAELALSREPADTADTSYRLLHQISDVQTLMYRDTDVKVYAHMVIQSNIDTSR